MRVVSAQLPDTPPIPAPLAFPAEPVEPLRDYTFVPAFPGVLFEVPVQIVTPPGETNRLFVVEKKGRIRVIPDLSAPEAETFLDLSAQVVSTYQEQGLLGLAFHPAYASNGTFFVYYVGTTNTTSGTGWHCILAKGNVSSTNANRANTTLQPLLAQYDFNPSHQAGALAFGPDGYLYFSVGDGGGIWIGNNQRVNGGFFGGIFRIDVDGRPGSLPPNPHPAIKGPYWIPADNPYIGITQFNGQAVDPQQVRTEFYAMGLRNPWTFGFDPDNGDLICGDVGEVTREELNRIVKGGNYGYPFREGTLVGPTTSAPPAGFSPVEPLLDYERDVTFGRYNGHCIIYGLKYRGTRFPGLTGKHIFGDFGSWNVWSATIDASGLSEWTFLNGGGFWVTRFGEDPRNGDILIARDLSDPATLMRMEYASTQPNREIPVSLAHTGLFADIATLTPVDGLIPYEINAPFWSDRAIKRRWFYLPAGADPLQVNEEGQFEFPPGTVWVKHFDLPLSSDPTGAVQRLETRVLVKTTNSVYGISYRYGGAVTNAYRVPPSGFTEEFDVDFPGEPARQAWVYPSANQCLFCHNPAAGHTVGFHPDQLNRLVDRVGGGQTNQLDWLVAQDWVANPESAAFRRHRLSGPDEEGISLHHRARSNLHANCAHCHRPGGPTPATWDLRLQTALDETGLLFAPASNVDPESGIRLLVPGQPNLSYLYLRMIQQEIRMPPLATSVMDTQSVALVSNWILSLSGHRSYVQWQKTIWGAGGSSNSGPDQDPDGDWATNYDEYLAGTQPLVAEAQVRMDLSHSPAGCPQLTWLRPAGARTVVEQSTTLGSGADWHPSPLPGNDPAEPSTNRLERVLVPTDSATRHFRLSTQPR
jgi:glucose/arabinose dehydrogenase